MDRPERLSHEESRLLAEHLASLAKSGLPLPPGLRAAAQEIPNRRLAAAMFALAEELDAGRSLDGALAKHPNLMPPHMQRLIETGVRSGNLPNVLVRLVDIDRTSFDLRRNLRQAVAYPLLLFVLLVAVSLFLIVYVAPGMKRVFTDFKTNLPAPTQILLKLSDSQILPIAGIALCAIIGCIFLLRFLLPPVMWQRLLSGIPLIGPTLQWRAVANWSRLLGLLLREEIPLPEAAQLAAEGVDSPVMHVQGMRISKAVAAGRRLEEAVGSIRSLPASLRPLLRWGEEHGALAEALDSSAEMFETRVQLRAALLRSILPPVAFIFIAMSILLLLNAMLMPLMKLITDLSGGFRNKERVNINTLESSAVQVLLALAIIWIVATLLIYLYRLIPRKSAKPSAARFRSARTSVRQLHELFRALYWIVFFLLLFFGMVIVANFVGILLWFATLVIAVMVKVRYAEMERRSLLWALAVAMEKQIPLPACAAAFADEC
ncbi:MAG TPA: type II secretion system F family protein, partial [Pirellulales bacterium]|nr:type II secretion system F family protein [Pirellulales bacterium]